MKNISLLTLSLASLLTLNAYADDTDSLEARKDFDHHVAAPSEAFEVGIATGYAQSAGPLGGNVTPHVEDVSRAGGAVELDAMYRINPYVAIGGYGTFAKFAAGNREAQGDDVLGATAGVQAAVHLRPMRSIDPWISLGSGWRGLWLSPDAGKNTSLQGLELARLQLGVDYRVNEDVSISPVIGGSLNMFLDQDTPMTTNYDQIEGKKANFTGFAGLAGRFDIGGKR